MRFVTSHRHCTGPGRIAWCGWKEAKACEPSMTHSPDPHKEKLMDWTYTTARSFFHHEAIQPVCSFAPWHLQNIPRPHEAIGNPWAQHSAHGWVVEEHPARALGYITPSSPCGGPSGHPHKFGVAGRHWWLGWAEWGSATGKFLATETGCHCWAPSHPHVGPFLVVWWGFFGANLACKISLITKGAFRGVFQSP